MTITGSPAISRANASTWCASSRRRRIVGSARALAVAAVVDDGEAKAALHEGGRGRVPVAHDLAVAMEEEHERSVRAVDPEVQPGAVHGDHVVLRTWRAWTLVFSRKEERSDEVGAIEKAHAGPPAWGLAVRGARGRRENSVAAEGEGLRFRLDEIGHRTPRGLAPRRGPR